MNCTCLSENGKVNTIYNIGRIQKADFPTTELKGSSRSKAETGNTANKNITQEGENANPKFSMKDVENTAKEIFGTTTD